MSAITRIGVAASAFAIMVANSLVGPAAGTQEPTAPEIEVQIAFESGVIANPVAPISIEPGEVGLITVALRFDSDATSGVAVDDTSSLLEIVEPSGAKIRLADMKAVGGGQYQARFEFSETGTWEVVALPDIRDRTSLTGDSTNRIVLTVQQGSASSSPTSGSWLGVGTILLLAIFVGILYLTRRPRRWDQEPNTRPFPTDTWWNSH